MAAWELFRGDALRAYGTWPAPATIISDGAYGVRGFHGDTTGPEALAGWYRPHIAAWSAAAGPGDHAVVLEHRDRLGNRAPGAGRARLGLRPADHLGQGPGPHRGKRERPDHQAVPGGDRGVRALPAQADPARAGRAGAGQGLGPGRVDPIRAAAAAGQRGLRGKERGHPEVPDHGLALVLAARGEDGAAGHLRQRAWQASRPYYSLEGSGRSPPENGTRCATAGSTRTA